MAFNTALSGIKASADFLSTTGNNIANSDTTGFKKSRVEFGDLYSSNVIGAGSNNTIGSGVSVNNIAQEFSSGNIAYTDNNLDLAVDGSGFFVLDIGGSQAYTRAGDFKLDADGFLVTNDGAQVQGYNAVNGIIGGALDDLRVPTERIAPEASTAVGIETNLNSEAEAVPPYIAASFDPGDPETYTFTQTENVADNGTPTSTHAVTYYYAKAESPNTYQVYASVDGNLEDTNGNSWLATDQFVTFDDANGSVSGTPFAPVYVGTTEPDVGDIPTPFVAPDSIDTITGNLPNGASLQTDLEPVDVETPANFARLAFDPADPETYTYGNTNTVYDALGEAHTIGYYFIKQGENNTWEMKVTIDGEINHPTEIDPGTGDPVPFLAEDTVVRFDNEGNLIGAYEGYSPYAVSSPTQLSITGWDPTNLNSELEIDLGKSTQYALSSSDTFDQDGYAAGELQGVSFDEDGFLIASYTNQQTAVLGQIALANFDNVDGLSPAGDTSWVASSSSGAANIGRANTGTFGGIQGGALEESNVDLTEELVALIEAQRNYQANSKTLETENTVTQTIINLR